MLDINALHRLLLTGTRVDPDCIPESGPVLVSKDMTALDLEPYQAFPTRQRGAYTATHLEDFIAYLTAHAEENRNPHCFIDTRAALPAITAVLDFGSPAVPQWGEHTATLALTQSAAYEALSARLRTNSQDDLLDFIDDWSAHCRFYRPDGAEITPAVARTEFADLTLEQVRTMKSKREDFHRERSAVEKISMGGGLPNRLIFTCAPLEGLSAHPLTVRLSAHDQAGTLGIKFTWQGEAEVEHALGDELITRLTEGLTGARVTVLRGVFTFGKRPA